MEKTEKINLATGHSLMDLDSLGSLAIAQSLFNCRAVRSKLSHPVAYNLYNVFKDYLTFMPHSAIKGLNVSKLIVVDTKDKKRINEVLDSISDKPETIEVFDHHIGEPCTIENAIVHNHSYGSNTTTLALLAKQKGLILSPQVATVAMVAIYSDTGSFKHSNVVTEDFEAAAYLALCGAQIALVKHFLKPPMGSDFENLIYSAKKNLEQHLILGKYITFFYLEIEKQTPGLSLIIDQLFEIEQPYALIGCIGLTKNKQIVVSARSSDPSVNMNQLLKPYGGGGHLMASSATIKDRIGRDIIYELITQIRGQLEPEKIANDLMDKSLECITLNNTMQEAEDFLKKEELSGVIVIDDEHRLAGSISLRQIKMAKKNGDMLTSIKGYINVDIATCSPSTSFNEIENIFFTKIIGRLPVIDENKKVLGIITRSNYLAYLQERNYV